MCYQWRIQDFPEEGYQLPRGGHQHMILPKFPKNCMKLKKFGPPGEHASLMPPLRSGTGYGYQINSTINTYLVIWFLGFLLLTFYIAYIV